MKYVIEIVARRIAGDIVLSEDIGKALRKWREVFGFSQTEVARAMGVSPSVLSDYEKNRRCPGAKFVKKFVEALLKLDSIRGYQTIKKIAGNLILLSEAVLELKEFSKPVTIDELVSAVKGFVVNSVVDDRHIYGFTVLDSIKAITMLSGHDFWYLMGLTSERALIFTNVSFGRSPMVAIRVAPIKPAVVVLHGPRRTIDSLAVLLSDKERIPLVISTASSVNEIIDGLNNLV